MVLPVAHDLGEIVGIGIGGQLTQEVAQGGGLSVAQIGERKGRQAVHAISLMACCRRSSGR